MVSIDLTNLSIEDLKKKKKIKELNWKKSVMSIKKTTRKTKTGSWNYGNRKQRKKIIKAKSTPKEKSKQKPKHKIKTCIQNKKIPKDIPPYLKKALVGIKHEISALDNFAEKKCLRGRTSNYANWFFWGKNPSNKRRNTKIKMMMVRLMDKKRQDRSN